MFGPRLKSTVWVSRWDYANNSAPTREVVQEDDPSQSTVHAEIEFPQARWLVDPEILLEPDRRIVFLLALIVRIPVVEKC